jgi:hypothetical protein
LSKKDQKLLAIKLKKIGIFEDSLENLIIYLGIASRYTLKYDEMYEKVEKKPTITLPIFKEFFDLPRNIRESLVKSVPENILNLTEGIDIAYFIQIKTLLEYNEKLIKLLKKTRMPIPKYQPFGLEFD